MPFDDLSDDSFESMYPFVGDRFRWTCANCGQEQYDYADEEYYVCVNCETVYEMNHDGELVIAEEE